MTSLPLEFPVLAFMREYGANAEEGRQELEWFFDEDTLTSVDAWTLKHRPHATMFLVDAAGGCWRVLGVTDLGAVGTSWKKLLRIIFRGDRRIRYQLSEEAPLGFEAVKERVCTSIQASPDDWRDDEAIAGESGPPLDEQEMLDDLTERARRAADMRELIAVLDHGHGD